MQSDENKQDKAKIQKCKFDWSFLLEPTQASKTAPVYQVTANRSRSFSPRSKYMDPTTDE